MPSWKRVIVSGSNAALNSLTVSNGITGSLFGTSSWAVSSSFASTASFLNGGTTNAFIQNGNSFGTTAVLGTNDNNSLAFETSGSTRMFISSSGNVGIGTTDPAAKMDIITGSDRYAMRIGENSANTDGSWTGIKFQLSTNTSNTDTQDGGVSLRAYRYAAGNQFQFLNGATVLGAFGGAANGLGIGTTTPNAKLDVNGNAIITGSLAVSQSLLQYSNITAVTSGSTSNVASFNTSSYTAAFFDYVTTSGTNARAGTVFTVWNGNSVEYTETSTNDIGSTSNLILSASVTAGAVRLQATSLSGSWSVKTLARMI